VVRALAADTVPVEWSAVPHWRERPVVTQPDRRATVSAVDQAAVSQ
jgi:hypothetical protein